MSKRTPVSFENTEIAYSGLSNSELYSSYRLFMLMNQNWLVDIGSALAPTLIKIPFIPTDYIIKKTIFKQFVGGESLRDSYKVVKNLKSRNVLTILDYGVEAVENERELERTAQYLVKLIHNAKEDEMVGIISCKITGLTRHSILEKVSNGDTLSEEDEAEFERGKSRVKFICKTAAENGIQVYFDAEESWIQPAIDMIVEEMMMAYNKQKAIVFQTVQLYRHDKLQYLYDLYEDAKKYNYILGVKIVRGAYLEKENDRAEKMGYPTPMQPNIEATHRDYNEALDFCLDHIDYISFCNASHNEDSCHFLVKDVDEKKLPRDHPHIITSQLYGMGDVISFNLAAAGFNVAKYLPFGPVKDVVPYLMRRAQENKSVAGNMGRELALIKEEIARRKNR